MEEIMNTYKVQMVWDFIVESPSETAAEWMVASKTFQFFDKATHIPEFAYEKFIVTEIDSQGAGVDARL